MEFQNDDSTANGELTERARRHIVTWLLSHPFLHPEAKNILAARNLDAAGFGVSSFSTESCSESGSTLRATDKCLKDESNLGVSDGRTS